LSILLDSGWGHIFPWNVGISCGYTVSIPDQVLAEADKVSKELGVSRGQLYTGALSRLVAEYRKRRGFAVSTMLVKGRTPDLAPSAVRLKLPSYDRRSDKLKCWGKRPFKRVNAPHIAVISPQRASSC
jgi:hypothetical protein